MKAYNTSVNYLKALGITALPILSVDERHGY